MNLNNLNKVEFIESLNKLKNEIENNLSDLSVNKIERYMNVDTNEQTFVIKVGQFKINTDQLLEVIKQENNDLELIEEKTSLSMTSETKVIELSTLTKEIADELKALVNYTDLDMLEEILEEDKIKYILTFRFTKEK